MFVFSVISMTSKKSFVQLPGPNSDDNMPAATVSYRDVTKI